MLQSVFCFPDLPDGKPRITGIKEKYQIGEQLEAMCTSWQSHPAANLTWFINEEPVSASKANQLWKKPSWVWSINYHSESKDVATKATKGIEIKFCST